jgi:hypothetical protein
MPTIARPASPVSTRSVLPTKWATLIRDGDTDGHYQTSHAAVMAAAVPCARAGWTVHDWTTAMTDPRNTLANHYHRKDDGRPRTHSNSMGRILRDWAKATRYATDHPRVNNPAEAMQHLGLVRSTMARTPWAGRTGLRDRIILEAILDIAETKPTTCPTISIRSLCEQTPYRGNQTAMRALHHLTDLGWLTPDRTRSGPGQPTAYRLGIPTVSETGAAGCALPGGVGAAPSSDTLTGPVGRISHDLALRFGPQSALVYSTLDPDIPQRIVTVTSRSGLARSTVNKWLPELAILGLAYKTPGGWHQGLRDVDLVAVEQGSLDLAEARAVRHDLQRRGWVEWIEARRRAGFHGG